MSMAEEFVTLERREDGVALITLNRPKMNALSRLMLRQLAMAAAQLIDTPPGAVVIYGGDRLFAAGADIEEFGGPEEALMVGDMFREALERVASIPRATIAAITGYALGGGCELALACDFRVAADDAKLGQPEVLLGIIPGGGATQRLPRLIGHSRAKDLIMTGRQVGAEEALAIGLVNRVVPAGTVLDAALAWAGELAAGPSVAHAMAKSAIDQGLTEANISEGLGYELQLFQQVFKTKDAQAGVQSFREHGPGKATFTGH
jgi:enoyl-CoA hydratase